MKTISVAFFTGFYGTMKRNKPAAIINQTVKIVKMTRQLIILKAIFHFTDPKKNRALRSSIFHSSTVLNA